MANKWYSADNKPLDIPTFQDLQDVTGQVFDDAGLYIGPAELPKQQLVIDNVTKRQYYAPKEYTENAIRYAEAKRNEYFKPEDWYGMENIKADYTLGEQVIGGAAALGKSVTGLLGQLPTKIVYTGAVFANQLSKAIAQGNSTDIAKMKNGMLVEQENLYRMSMKNWEKTLHKYGLINEPEIQYMTGGKIGSMIGDIGGSLLTAAIVSSAGGLPAVAAVFGSNQFADVMEEGLAKGLSHDKAFAAAWKAALAEGGLEAAGFRLWRSAATVSKSFRNKMLAFAWEGAQESSQQTAESIITNYYGIREQTFMEIMADVLLSGLIGGVVGFAGASLSGQVEQRNIALRRDIGMTDRGQIVTPKAQEVKEVQPVTTTKEAEKSIIDNEIAQAKKTGDNKLYNIVKYSANDHGITDEATIDKMYPVARKAIADGATLDDLTDILANQIVAYNNQLEKGQTDTKATQKAVEQIKLVTDPNRVDEWREGRKSELEKAGVSKRDARIATKNFARTISNLSQRLGFDITKKYDVSFEKRAPVSETLQQIKEDEAISFDFGENEGDQVSTREKLIGAYNALGEGLRAKKAIRPRRHLLTVLREKGADYASAGAVDAETYKNARIPNKKSGIGDKLSDFLVDNGFMGKGYSSAESYEEGSALEQEAADLIDRALSGEKIFTLDDQEKLSQRENQEQGQEWSKQEMEKIQKDLTRGQISFLGKVAKIALGETFDFTTLEHEFFHFIDRVVLDAAKEGNVEAQKLVKKRDEIIKKAKAELKKRGIKEMPIDEEILASAYEKWLWQGGKSEDAYEQRLFNAIREFFREVYDTVKGLMGIRISPEMDVYFRAMTGEVPNTFYQFAGQTAMTSDRLALSKAKEMETSGADNETIRQETGWFKGVDGKWRFEISDSDASVSKAVKTLKKDAVESTEKFNKKIDEFNKKLQKLSDEKKTEEYEKVMDQKLSYIEEQKKPKEKTFKLGDFLQHENLYKAYPELKELRLDIKPMKPNEAGGYSERRKLIELNASLVMTSTEESTKKTLLHEIAHYIQHRENFAAGGSPSQFRSKRMGPSAKRTDYKRAIDSAILYNKLVAAKTKGLKTNLNWPSAAYVEQFLPDLEKLAKEDEAVRKTLDDWKEANEKLKEYDKNTALMKYKRLGGEIEARNVEARSEFTPLETAMISPESTQDIKNADAIVVFDDGTELSYTTTESPNIYYQDDKNLAVVHKISSSSFEKAIDLGGFPVPSIGIINKNQPFNIGGDITLVGTSDIIDPSISSNEVYNRDVWSKTFPQTEYKRTTAKARDAFSKKFSHYFERTQESTGALSSMMYTAQAKNPAGVISEFERSLAAKVAYIETVQGGKVNIETKDRSLDVLAKSMWDRWSFRIDEQFVKEAEEAYKIDDSKERNNAIAKAVEGAFYRTDYSGFGEESDKLKKEMYQNLFEKDGSLNWNAANDIEYRVGEYLSKRGKKTVDYWELRDQLDKQIKNMDDFYEWATKTVQEDLLGEPMLRVGRTLKPFTLENVTKAMISGTTKNAAEALIFGPGKVVAAGAQRLRSIKEIKAAGKKLLTPKQASEQMETLTQEIIAFANEVAGLKQSDFSSAMTRAEDVMRALASVTDKKTPTAEALQRALNYELAENDTYSKELLDAGVKIANNIRNLSRDYFEAKPQRAVSLSEFVGAIIPTSNKYDEIAKKAEDAGLQVVRSDNQTEALSSFSDTFFQSDYQQEQTQEELFRNNQALKEGAKVLDKAPTNEQVEEELATIRSGRVVEAEPKRGFGLAESIGDFVLTVRQRVGTIDKRLKYAFDKLDFNEKMYESKYGKNVVGYIKKYRKLDDTLKRELDYLILNKQDERIREFVRQNDMLEEYNQARTLLDNLYVEGNKAGMDMGFLQEYFPTKVVDPEGLITYLKGTDKWTEIERALAEIDPNNQMSIEDRANAINNILRGYNRADPISKQGFQNERLIFHKTPEMMKFYAPSDEALMRYVSGMSSALAIRNAFNVKNAFHAEESIGGVVQELIKSGQITYKEESFIRKMLKARLNYARTAPMVALLKNFGYLGTMNNITSAVTQIGDLYANFYKYNFGTAMKALFGKREITKEDLHIDSIWEEFADAGWTGIAVNKLFSAIGLNKFDKFGKETAINGAWIDLKERLKNNDVSLLEDLSAAFGSRAKQVMEDIKNNNITEDVKLLLWTQLADTQPLGKSGVPVGYLNNPHGRIVYQLKTYTINQLSLFYADGIYKINKGLATKNKKLFLQGIGNTAKLALLLTIFNASADALKNLIMGRKIDISDTLLSNMLWNIGVSKYTFYRGQRDGYARALLENYLLPPQISMGDDAYMDIKKIATGKRKPSDTIAVTYVPFGRMWYWWFGGGRTQEKKKGNKPFEVEL